MLRERDRDLRQRLARERDGVDREDRVVPVVNAAEQHARLARSCALSRRRNAERRNGDERLERRVGLEYDRIQSSGGEKHSEPEQSLRFGGTEEKIAAKQRLDQSRVIVREDFRAARFVIVKILDDERIVEIDDGGHRTRVSEEI